MEKQRIVIDTTALISYFEFVFNKGSRISNKAKSLIDVAFEFDDKILLTIPSIVFVEIFDKWFRGDSTKDEEFRAKFRAEVFERIRQAPNIEIREIDIEVLENFVLLDDSDINLENHDRLILAAAVALGSSLITSDNKIHTYVEKYKVIPSVIL